MRSEIDYFAKIIEISSQLLSGNQLLDAAFMHYEFMQEIIRFLSEKYLLKEAYENPFNTEMAYLKIRKKLEEENKEALSQSLALAWKSAKEIQDEVRSGSLASEDLIKEDIDNIRRFWNKIKNFIKE